MKRIFLFAGVLLLLTSSSAAWNPYPTTLRLLQDIPLLGKLFSSPIPQFILDTNHPWLATNKAWLSRYPNITQEICNLDSSLWTTTPSTGHVLPADLLTNLSIDNTGPDGTCRGRVAWSNARDRLQEMAACKASLAAARNLHVNMFLCEYDYPNLADDMMPPPGLPELFADVLAQMSNLERLDWGMHIDVTRVFEAAFVAKGLMLPSVKYLKPGAGSDYLVSRCPNLEVLDQGGHPLHWSWTQARSYASRKAHLLELIKSSTGLKSLQEWHLWPGTDGWTTDQIRAILAATPNITGLRMSGNLEGIATIRASTATAKSRYAFLTRPIEQTLKSYLELLALFPNLENLQLPASYDLGLGFDGGHWCGNAYDGPEGRAYGRSVTQQGAETIELAANIATGALPHLKSLSIGSSHANLTINDGGQPDMTWPWTGRMGQYTYEMWEE